MAVSNPSLDFSGVQVDNSVKIGAQGHEVQGMLATMGTLVTNLSTAQTKALAQITDSVSNANASIFSKETMAQYKQYWILAGVLGIFLLFRILRKRKR